MDVTNCPVWDACSPEEEQEEQQCLLEDSILRESESDQDLDRGAGSSSDMEVEENAARELGSNDEDKASQPKSQDQDTDANELGRRPASSLCENDEDKDRTTDPRDEDSSVTRELYEHVLDYDKEFPEYSVPAVQEVEAEKPGAKDIEHKGDGAPREEEKPGVKNVEEKESLEAAKEKKKEDGDGENDNGAIDDDLEEGEVREPSDRKVRPGPICQFFMKEVVPPLPTLFAPISNSLPFRSQVKGNCIWGMNCKFLHPGVNDKGNYSLISKADPHLPNSAPPLGTHSLMPVSPWRGRAIDDILPPPPPESPTESAWERGLRHAKEVLKKANIRKAQEPGFEEKRFMVTVGEDQREFDWHYQIARDTRDTALEPYADPYQDYDIEWFPRGGQYENYRVPCTEREPYPNVLERERQRRRERERDVRQREQKVEEKRDRERERWQGEWGHEHQRERDRDLQRRKEEWERERAKWDKRNRQHRDRDREKEREKDKEKPRSWSHQLPSRQAEPPKKATAAGPQVKRADEWKDPWRRSKSPMKKLGFSVSPKSARRGRKTSASSTSASNSSRSSSGSSSSCVSGSSRSSSRSSSCSSYSSRSSRHSPFSGSRSRSGSSSSSPSPTHTSSRQRLTVGAKGELAPPPRKAGKKLVKKPAPLPASASSSKSPAPAPKPAKPRESPEARRKEQPARRPPRKYTQNDSNKGRSCCRNSSGSSSRSRSSSVTSVSSVSSTTWSSCSMHSVDSEDMYGELASPRSSTNSRSPTPAQAKKEKGKSQKEDGLKEDKQKMDSSTPAPKSRKPPAGTRASQPPSAPQQAPHGQAPRGAFIAHKEIKLTLLNKVTDKRSRKQFKLLEDRQCPPAKRAKTSPDRDSHHQKSGGRLGSPMPERERRQNPRASLAQPDRKHQGSPSQPKGSSRVTIVPGKASHAHTASASGTNSGRASRQSRRKELLKQLKAVEDAIQQKLAKTPGKVECALRLSSLHPTGY